MLCFYKTAAEAKTPLRGSRGACGIDLPMPNGLTISPGKKVSVDLLLEVSLPPGHFGLLKLRSGAARRHKLLLHAGVIGEKSIMTLVRTPASSPRAFSDSDYTGGIVLLLENVGDTPVELREGDAYVQLIPVKYFTGPVLGASDFGFRVERGLGNFGSTGVNAEALAAILAQDVAEEVTVRTTPAENPVAEDRAEENETDSGYGDEDVA